MADKFNFGSEPVDDKEGIVVPTWAVTITVAIIVAMVVDRMAERPPIEIVIS